MQGVFPAHHQRRIRHLLKGAKADLLRRGIDPGNKTGLQIFSLRATEKTKERSRLIAAKLARASRQV